MTPPPTQTPEDKDTAGVSSTLAPSKPNPSHPRGGAECSSPTAQRDKTKQETQGQPLSMTATE